MKITRKGFTLVELLIVVAIIASLSAMMMMASSESIDTANANAILSNLQSMKVSAYEMYMTVPEVAALKSIANNEEAVTPAGGSATTVGAILGERLGRKKAMVASDAYNIVGDDSHWYVVYTLQGTDSTRVKNLLASKATSAGLYGATSLAVSGITTTDYYTVAEATTHIALMVR